MPTHLVNVKLASKLLAYCHTMCEKGKLMNLYVGNLSYQTTTAELQTAFAKFGSVVKANIIMDRETGRSKGFGFVEMADTESANKAITELNGKDFGGRDINVTQARPRAY